MSLAISTQNVKVYDNGHSNSSSSDKDDPVSYLEFGFVNIAAFGKCMLLENATEYVK